MQNFNQHPGAEEAGAQPDQGNLARVAQGVAHVVGGVASILSMQPYSPRASEAIQHATADRRAGDRVNPTTVDISSFVNTDHRT